MHDRNDDNLTRPYGGVFVVRVVKFERVADFPDFAFVIGVGNVQGSFFFFFLSGKGGVVDREADVFRLVPVFDEREEFSVGRIDQINGDLMDIKKPADVLLDVNEDLVDAGGGIDSAGDVLDGFMKFEIF